MKAYFSFSVRCLSPSTGFDGDSVSRDGKILRTARFVDKDTLAPRAGTIRSRSGCLKRKAISMYRLADRHRRALWMICGYSRRSVADRPYLVSYFSTIIWQVPRANLRVSRDWRLSSTLSQQRSIAALALLFSLGGPERAPINIMAPKSKIGVRIIHGHMGLRGFTGIWPLVVPVSRLMRQCLQRIAPALMVSAQKGQFLSGTSKG